jgi:hypothetical protein
MKLVKLSLQFFYLFITIIIIIIIINKVRTACNSME